MKCHTCGGDLSPVITDLPFKREHSIVIVKSLPALQCGNCGEYLLEDSVLAWVEKTLENVNPATELEIVRYAA